MLKCAPGVWQKRELYIIEKSPIVFEKKNIMLKTVASCPGLPYPACPISMAPINEYAPDCILSCPNHRGNNLAYEAGMPAHTSQLKKNLALKNLSLKN